MDDPLYMMKTHFGPSQYTAGYDEVPPEADGELPGLQARHEEPQAKAFFWTETCWGNRGWMGLVSIFTPITMVYGSYNYSY